MIVSYIDAYRDRFGVVPICDVLTEHGMPIAPSTYYALRKTPVSEADLADAYLANALPEVVNPAGRVDGGPFRVRDAQAVA